MPDTVNHPDEISCAIVIVYIGKLPSNFPLYLEGVKNNPSIDILFFGDQELDTADFPKNFKFHRKTFSQIKELIMERVGCHKEINPYKLCDYKPMLNRLFEEYLISYDYWGWGDIDLIYGNIQGYIKEKVDAGYSIISFREHWVSGSLFILKNTPFINTLYLRSENLEDVISIKKHLSFDECFNLYSAYESANDILKCEPEKQCFTKLILEAHKNCEVQISFSDSVKEWLAPNDFVKIDFTENIVFDRDGAVYPYYHFVCDKSRPFFIVPERDPQKNAIVYFNRYGLFSEKEFQNGFLRKVIELKRYALCFPDRLLTFIRHRLK